MMTPQPDGCPGLSLVRMPVPARGATAGLLAAALVVLACASPARTPAPAPLLAVHLAHDRDAPGRVAHTYDGRALYLDPEPVFTDADVARGVTSARGENLVLSIELTDEAARRVEAVTGANIGAVLAVLSAGDIIQAPVIRGAIRGRGQITVGGPGLADDVVAERILERWPPDPPSQSH